jgi:hypothetical protein
MSKRSIGVDADVWSEGSLEVLSQHETDLLKNVGTGGLYPLFAREALTRSRFAQPQ